MTRNTSLCLEILVSAFLWHTKEYAKNYFSVFRMTFLENIYFFTHKTSRNIKIYFSVLSLCLIDTLHIVFFALDISLLYSGMNLIDRFGHL